MKQWGTWTLIVIKLDYMKTNIEEFGYKVLAAPRTHRGTIITWFFVFLEQCLTNHIKLVHILAKSDEIQIQNLSELSCPEVIWIPLILRVRAGDFWFHLGEEQ